MKTDITISFADLALVTDKNNDLVITKHAGKLIMEVLLAKERVEQALSAIQDYLAAQMAGANVIRIQTDDLIVRRGTYGRKFAAEDITTLDPAFVKDVSYQIVDTQAVSDYVDYAHTLPDGIVANAREQKVTIEKR